MAPRLTGALMRTCRDFRGNVAVERLLSAVTLGDRLVDQVIAALFCRRVGGGSGETLPRQALAVGALLVIAIGLP